MTDWPLSTEPEHYLDRYPDGPNADLARRVLAERHAAAEAERTGYRTSLWRDLVNYHCPDCPFDTIDLARMHRHARAHARPTAPEPARIVRFDRFGNALRED